MSEKFKKDLDNINLSEDLKNRTIAKMQSSLGEKKKTIIFLRRSFLLPITSFLFVAIIFTFFIFKGPFNNTVKAEDLLQGIKADKVETKGTFSKEFLDSVSSFSFSMFKQLSKEKNALYSPTSLYLSLGTVLNGTDCDTKEQLLKALSKYGLTENDINVYCKGLISDLSKDKKVLNISNSIWYDDKLAINKDFLKATKTYYNTSAYKLDLQKPNTIETMNKWVTNSTNNKIDKIVNSIDPSAAMLIFSSIYFDNQWKYAFPKENTHKGNFITDNNSTIETDFMSQKSVVRNLSNSVEQLIALPYKDEIFTFVAMMPKDNTDIRTYIANLNDDVISSKINTLKSSEVIINLPKFKIEFCKELNNELSSLGMKDIFDASKSNLSKMSQNKDGLFVKSITQNSYLSLDENGTKAASVTKTEITKSAMISNPITFNRPFVYAVIDNRTKLPVFMGVMDDPSGK
ncbi:serpin family protein [Clostridium sp. C8-1-8]|uniref:serpin family protein n=1 Tax=Clostridium sp. C8-1-8 TaxID=2698831 RepID=UPI0013696EC3|nr:serpin family protein [Clostridium sp. C8-1-8]